MKKTILMFLILLISIVSALNISANAFEANEISGLNSCTKIFFQSDSSGVFAYGLSNDTLSVYDCNSNVMQSVSVDGRFKSNPVINNDKVYCIYYDQSYNYSIIILDLNSGESKTISIEKSSINRYTQIAVSDNSYLILSCSLFTYVSEYSFNGDLIHEYNFDGKNVNSLFMNSGEVYAVLTNGEVYNLENGSSKYCVIVNSETSLTNAGDGYAVDTYKSLYSLNENKTFEHFASIAEYISVSGDTVCYSLDNTVYLSDMYGNINKVYNLDSSIDLLTVCNNKAYIITDSFSRILIVDFNEFSSYQSGDSDNIIDKPNKANPDISYKFDNEIIYNVHVSATVSDFENTFNQTVSIFDKNRKEVTSGKLKTGYTVDISGEKYTLAVKGDVTGTGSISSHDIYLLMDHITGKTELFEAYKKAADYNLDGCVDNKDLLLISREMD